MKEPINTTTASRRRRVSSRPRSISQRPSSPICSSYVYAPIPSRCALNRSRRAPAISVLYCMEREHPHRRSPSPSIYRRHRYASPSSPIQTYSERHFLAPPSGTGIAATYTLSQIGQDIVFNRKQERITNSFFACTLALNAVCTGASYITFVDEEDNVFDIFPSGLLSPHQVLSRSASGGPRSRRATPRWAPTSYKSRLLSLSLVCFFISLSSRCDAPQSHT